MNIIKKPKVIKLLLPEDLPRLVEGREDPLGTPERSKERHGMVWSTGKDLIKLRRLMTLTNKQET